MPVVQRRVDDADVAWAQGHAATIERIQTAVHTAENNLTDDARAAISALGEVQTEYAAFEQRYDDAAADVREGIAAARAREAEMEAGLSSAFDLVLFAAGGPWVSAARATVRTLRAVSAVKGYVDALGHAGTVVQGAGGSTSGGSAQDPVSRIPVRSRHVDWDEAMDVTLEAFNSHVIQQNDLNGIDARCDNHLNFLANVRDRSHTGDDPQSSRHGESAQAMADASSEIIRRLGRFQSGTVSGPVERFKEAALEPLRGTSLLDLKRQITLRLIAGLSYSEAGDSDGVIRGGKDYLREIGLIDENGNVLNFDTGWGWVTDAGAQVIRLLAQSEAGAMSLVGSTARWLGGMPRIPGARQAGMIETGSRQPSVSAPGSRRTPTGTWFATAPETPALEPGDRVEIVSYETDREERTKWTSHGRSTRRSIQGEVKYRVRPA